MSGAKFTPGPWIAVYRGCNGAAAEGDVHQKEKWDADPFDGGFMRGEFKWHDACLIAAAPELYEALNGLIVFCSDTLSGRADGPSDTAWLKDGYREIRERCRIALAKARGETP